MPTKVKWAWGFMAIGVLGFLSNLVASSPTWAQDASYLGLAWVHYLEVTNG